MQAELFTEEELRHARLELAFGPVVAVPRTQLLQQLALTDSVKKKKKPGWDPRKDASFNKGMDKFKTVLADDLCKVCHDGQMDGRLCGGLMWLLLLTRCGQGTA